MNKQDLRSCDLLNASNFGPVCQQITHIFEISLCKICFWETVIVSRQICFEFERSTSELWVVLKQYEKETIFSFFFSRAVS